MFINSDLLSFSEDSLSNKFLLHFDLSLCMLTSQNRHRRHRKRSRKAHFCMGEVDEEEF